MSQRQHFDVGVDLVERQVKTGNNFTPNKRETHSLGILCCLLLLHQWTNRWFFLFSVSFFFSFLDVIFIYTRKQPFAYCLQILWSHHFSPLKFECSTRCTNKAQHRHSFQMERRMEKDQKRQYRIFRRSTENRFSTDTVALHVERSHSCLLWILWLLWRYSDSKLQPLIYLKKRQIKCTI